MNERTGKIFCGVEKFIRRLGWLTLLLIIVGGVLCMKERHDIGGPLAVAGALCGLVYMVLGILFWLHVPENFRDKIVHSAKNDEKQK